MVLDYIDSYHSSIAQNLYRAKKNKKNKELTPDQFIKNRIKLISKMRPRTCNEVFIDQTIFTYNLSIVQGSK